MALDFQKCMCVCVHGYVYIYVLLLNPHNKNRACNIKWILKYIFHVELRLVIEELNFHSEKNEIFPSGSEVKASASNVGDLSSIPGSEDPLEKEMVTHSSILAWRIPWTEEPGRLQSTGSKRVRHDWETSL